RNPVGRESALAGVLLDQLLVRGDVHAVNLVVGDVAVQPLDARAQPVQDAAGLLREGLKVPLAHSPRVRDVPLDEVFRHFHPSLSRSAPLLLRDMLKTHSWLY